MIMSWVLFTLIAVNLWAIGVVIDKHVLSKHVKNPIIPISVQSISSFVVIALLFLFAKIQVPDLFHLLVSIFSGVMMFFGIVIYFKALKREELSRIIPLFSTSAIFTLLIATVFLSEIFTIDKYFGIALLVAGSFLISYKPHKRKGRFSEAYFLMLTSSFIYAATYSIIKYLSLSMDFVSIFALSELGIGLSALISFAIHRKEIITLWTKNRKIIFLIIIASFFAFAGYLLFYNAISQGPVSLVVALNETEGFFVLLYATLISIFMPSVIKEETKGSVVALKLLAIAIIFAGAYLVSV